MGDYFEENSSTYWSTRAQITLRNQLTKKRIEKVAKNVIFFLGDGMSIATLTASRIYMGQKKGNKGEESKLSFEEFPYTGLSKVSKNWNNSLHSVYAIKVKFASDKRKLLNRIIKTYCLIT